MQRQCAAPCVCRLAGSCSDARIWAGARVRILAPGLLLSVEGESQSPSGRLRKAQVRRAGGHRVGRRALRREAVGEFPGSDDFLYINDKKSILRWAISVSGAPLRPPAALL